MRLLPLLSSTLLATWLVGQSRPATSPRALEPGAVVTGTLTAEIEHHDLGSWVRSRQTEFRVPGIAFTFRAPAPGAFTVSCGSLEFDVGMLILDHQRRTRRFVDDGGDGVDARTTLRASAAGDTFAIVVCDPDGEYGHFELRLEAGQPAPLAGDELQRRRVARLRAALAECRARFAADDPRIASRASDLARALPASGSYDEPEELYRAALAARITRYGEDHMIVALTRANLGSLLVQKGKLREAKELIESSARTYQSDDRLGPALLPGSLANLAAIDRIEGRYEQALERYGRVLEDALGRRGGGDEAHIVRCRNNYAGALLDCGRALEARAEFELVVKSRERSLGPRHVETLVAWNNLGDTWMRLGKYEEARRLFERAIAAAEESGMAAHPVTARVLGNFAMLAIRQDRPGEAEPALRRALAILEKNFSLDHPDRIQSLCTLATLALQRGASVEAEPNLREALRLARIFAARSPQTGVVLSMLARCELVSGRISVARSAMQDAITLLLEAYGDDGHTELAHALQTAADVRLAAGDEESAWKDQTRALAMFRRWLGEEHPTTRSAFVRLAVMARARGENGDAIDLLQRSLAGRPESIDQQIPLLSEHDRIAWARSQRRALDDLLALTALPGANPPPATVHRLVAGWKGLVARGLSRGRLRVQEAAAAATPEVGVLRGELQLVLAELARYETEVGTRNAAQRKASLTLLCERKARLERSLASALGGAETSESRPVRDPVPRDVAAGETLVDYFVYTTNDVQHLVAFVLRGTTVARHELGPLEPIRTAIDAHRRLLARMSAPDARGTNDALLEQVGLRVRNALLDPFVAQWRDAERIAVAPDGPLVLLPFATLPGRSPGTFLLEDHELVTLASLGPRPRVASRDSARPVALLVGGVAYGTDSRGTPRYPELPGSAVEVHQLGDVWKRAFPKGQAIQLEGAAAHEVAVKAALAGATYVHFATHGFCRAPTSAASRPGLEMHLLGVQSGIALAPRDATASGTEDGTLTAEELSWCDLRSCELVTLSACDTGLGTVQDGESLAGLRRSLRVAGAASTLTSLWRIEDDAARALMQRFSEGRWLRGESAGRALRAAQLQMLAHQRKTHAGQAVAGSWGAFVLEEAGR